MPDYKARLADFRQAMKQLHCDAFIIPHGDKWHSEMVEACDERLEYLTGLKASAGYAVITKDHAAVLIDDRYTISAEKQIDTNLFEIAYYTKILPEDWIIERSKINDVIGYDPWLHTRKDAKRIQMKCNELGLILQAESTNPVDQIWKDRPAPIAYQAINHSLKYAGKSAEDKLQEVTDIVLANDADSVIITAADSIAWLLNLRTIENTQSPGIKGFAILQCQISKLTVFTDVDCGCFDYSQTKKFEVDFLPLDEFQTSIAYFERQEQVVQISDTSPDWFTEHLNSPASEIIREPDPCELLKSCKNETEQQGIRDSHMRDAVAMIKCINWIKSSSNLTEKQIEQELLNLRSKTNLFRGVSFNSIVGWNANGAKIHGSPTDTVIKGDGLLLIDSGGQYDDGTTDITRTIAIGHISEEMCEKYTLVLKAHIALATSVFPEGTTGAQLDAIVRAPLWKAGIDFSHGTGHGVGYFLNVHEGPCSISPRSNEQIKEGMLLSNEPGYYKKDAYGIRLENLMLVKNYMEADNKNNQTGKKLLCFETVTKVPFDDVCINKNMLTHAEILWLKQYQEQTTLQ